MLARVRKTPIRDPTASWREAQIIECCAVRQLPTKMCSRYNNISAHEFDLRHIVQQYQANLKFVQTYQNRIRIARIKIAALL